MAHENADLKTTVGKMRYSSLGQQSAGQPNTQPSNEATAEPSRRQQATEQCPMDEVLPAGEADTPAVTAGTAAVEDEIEDYSDPLVMVIESASEEDVTIEVEGATEEVLLLTLNFHLYFNFTLIKCLHILLIFRHKNTVEPWLGHHFAIKTTFFLPLLGFSYYRPRSFSKAGRLWNW